MPQHTLIFLLKKQCCSALLYFFPKAALQHTLKFFLQLMLRHGDNGWAAMGAVIWILQGQQLSNQRFRLLARETMVALYRRFAGPGCSCLPTHLRRHIPIETGEAV